MAYLDEAKQEATEELPDRATAHRLRDDLAKSREALKMFREQQFHAQERGDALERVVEGLSAALNVLDPPDKALDVTAPADHFQVPNPNIKRYDDPR